MSGDLKDREGTYQKYIYKYILNQRQQTALTLAPGNPGEGERENVADMNHFVYAVPPPLLSLFLGLRVCGAVWSCRTERYVQENIKLYAAYCILYMYILPRCMHVTTSWYSCSSDSFSHLSWGARPNHLPNSSPEYDGGGRLIVSLRDYIFLQARVTTKLV